MALDVRLRRQLDQPWGFRLIGGVDFEMPLTVVKVQPSSPAEEAGLRNGDTLVSISGVGADSMCHDDAYSYIKSCSHELLLKIIRGRYDAILDDQEPIFQSIEPEDLDQPSDPTEVFAPIPEIEAPEIEVPQVLQSRSLTASPFILPTKPYRPFSTEPIPDVPPLEEPIILNPNYHDEFGSHDESEFLPKSKFKLPISEQYDPNFGKGKRVTKNVSGVNQSQICQQTWTQEEVDYMAKARQDIDLEMMEKTITSSLSKELTEQTSTMSTVQTEQVTENLKTQTAEINSLETVSQSAFSDEQSSKNVEYTASAIVDECIKKAVSVAEIIKQEMESESQSSMEVSNKLSESIQDHESAETIIMKQDNLLSEKELKNHENPKTNAETFICAEQDKKRSSSRQEIAETIQAGSVKRLSESYEQDTHISKTIDSIKCINKKNIIESKTETHENKYNLEQKHDNTSKNQNIKTVESTIQTDSKKKYSSSKLLAEQRAYSIGLQTIPKIRGHLHTSYHYNLLLKTFFIHLTDVMVALSRFILTEPVLSESSNRSEEAVNKLAKDVSINLSHKETYNERETELKEDILNTYEETLDKEENNLVSLSKELNEVESGKKQKLSGQKMALLGSEKTEELTTRMGAVISEFQNKAGIEDVNIEEQQTLSEKGRRSVSRSNIEEEVANESDPLEWLAKVETEKSHQEIKIASTELSSTTKQDIKELKQNQIIESKQNQIKSKSGKNTYIAIVESHVYTNKDTILDEQFSDTSSIKSPEASNTDVFLEGFHNELISTVDKSSAQEKTVVNDVIDNKKNIEDACVFTKKSEDVCKGNKEKVIERTMANQELSQTVDLVSKIAIVDDKTSFVDTIDTKEVTLEQNKIESTKLKANIVNEFTAQNIDNQISQDFLQTHEASITKSSNVIESSQIKSVSTHKSSLRMHFKPEKKKLIHQDSFPSTIDTPTPATIPPTPLTDEYVFRLEIPMPKSRGPTPAPDEPSPEKEIEHEDPHIVKKKLVPHIDTKIERVVYDPPLPTPPDENNLPKFFNGGVESNVISGDADEKYSEEEILEIERKSSLLACAIDETIKSIEEYKEQVGIEKNSLPLGIDLTTQQAEVEKNLTDSVKAKTENLQDNILNTQVSQAVVDAQPMYCGVVTEAKTNIYAEVKPDVNNLSMEEKWSKVADQLKTNNEIRNKLSQDTIVESLAHDSMSSSFSQKEYVTMAAKVDILSNCYQENTFENSSQNMQSIDLSTVSHLKDNVESEVKTEALQGFRSVPFNPEECKQQRQVQDTNETNVEGFRSVHLQVSLDSQEIPKTDGPAMPRRLTIDGEILATSQGIINGLEDAVMNEEEAKELGKPGITEDKIAEIISGESEMLREAHVMGLSRVLNSHMTRVNDDDSSVDFQKIKPTIEKLKDSEVLKALNDELTKTKTEKKKEERKWTTFLQKPKRPMPKAKFGYHGWLPQFEVNPQEEYKVKIVKQPKPKVAPDYKPEDFETGPLPWEERAAKEPPPPPVTAEEPILIPEEGPQFFEAVDPLPESEVPDLEETGIPLPAEKEEDNSVPEPAKEEVEGTQEVEEAETQDLDLEAVVEETEQIIEEMEQNKLAEQLLNNVQSMVDPNATLEQQLSQMRLQLAALAQLPGVIQRSLELVASQLTHLSHQDTTNEVIKSETAVESSEQIEEVQTSHTIEETSEEYQQVTEVIERVSEEKQEMKQVQVTTEEMERMKREEEEMLSEQRKIEKQRKELMEQMQLEHQSRQLKQRPTPRVGKPTPAFGPLTPQERPLVLPGGRKWRKPKDAYNEQFISETLTAQAELIQGKTKGSWYESVLLPYDQRVNFMKYEKPPVSLEHLKDSDVYKMIHNMEQAPMRRVEMLTPVVAESDYREKCRSITPLPRLPQEEHLDIPQQVQP